jgi:uncharacterized protein
MGLKVEIFAATNGLLNKEQREFISKYFTTLNISLDGPRDIQDHNRPQKDGSGSFDHIYKILKYFNEVEFPYGIRTTITESIVNRMEEIVEYFGAEFHLSYLHFEPVWMCGRCLTNGEQPPSDEEFIQNFLKAVVKGREYGIDILYSGARLDTLTSKYCAAPGDGFSVLPNGCVTSCYEITESDNPKAAIFHYGYYERTDKKFIFNNERIKSLRKLSVENIEFCADCFCKWHCAGDCLSRVFDISSSTTHKGSSRCTLNRDITLAKLDEIVNEKKINI